MEKKRLDKYLIDKKLYLSRNKAEAAIKESAVFVNNKLVTSTSFLVNDEDVIEIKIKNNYVSRGAYKLLEAIKHWNLNLNNQNCIDVGCSTGGFSQVLLENNVNHIYAIDVGTKQFDKSIDLNKITLLENTHFLNIQKEAFHHKIDFICCDVSFISSCKIIEHVCKIIDGPFKMISLIKPQFELTKQILDKNKGLISDEKLWKQAINRVIDCAKAQNLYFTNVIDSPILGAKSGNKEFLILLERK